MISSNKSVCCRPGHVQPSGGRGGLLRPPAVWRDAPPEWGLAGADTLVQDRAALSSLHVSVVTKLVVFRVTTCNKGVNESNLNLEIKDIKDNGPGNLLEQNMFDISVVWKSGSQNDMNGIFLKNTNVALDWPSLACNLDLTLTGCVCYQLWCERQTSQHSEGLLRANSLRRADQGRDECDSVPGCPRHLQAPPCRLRLVQMSRRL